MRIIKTLAAAGLAAGFLATAALAQEARTIDLPPELNFPEGIAYDPDGPHIYTAGAVDGTVVRLDPRSGQSQILAKAHALAPNHSGVFPAFLGMKVDARKRLWIAGGRTQRIHVLDTQTGALVKSMSLPGEGSVLNDLVLTPDYAYVTDTFRPILWRVAISGDTIGEPEAWISLTDVVEYGTSPNMNGIAKTPDNRTLFIVHMSKGLLFKVDIATRQVTPFSIGGEDITSGDGLELDGDKLYVVRQAAAEVVTIQLAPDMSSGKVVARYKHPSITFAATAVKAGDELIVVSTQFNKRTTNDPVRPFRLTAVPLTALQGRP